MIKPTLRAMAASFVISAFAISNSVAEPVQKEELGKLIGEYLKNNPEVVITALDAYQQQIKDKSAEATKAAIKDKSKEIYHSPMDGSVGDKDAAVTIVEFFDYNCSACKYMFKPLNVIHDEGLDDVRIVFKEFPIFGETSQKLAKIAMAVNTLAPAKYYDFHKTMMETKKSITPAIAYDLAEDIGISRTSIEKELSKPVYEEALKKNKALGDTLQVRGTPFLIINDEPVAHALDEAMLRDYIAKAKK